VLSAVNQVFIAEFVSTANPVFTVEYVDSESGFAAEVVLSMANLSLLSKLCFLQ
jgi:hypothetical protein